MYIALEKSGKSGKNGKTYSFSLNSSVFLGVFRQTHQFFIEVSFLNVPDVPRICS
jgi:hypothetical protein